MNNFIYENKTKVYFGQGCVKEFLSGLLKNYDTVMMAYGQGAIKKNGIYDEILGLLMKAGKRIVEFSGIRPNPTYEKVLEGVKLAKDNKVQIILGIGGGSVMDCAKAVSLAARYEGDAWKNFWERRGTLDFDPIPVGVIPTSAGTGSESNGAAVITNEKLKIKTGYDYPKCNPEFALLDPVYTFSIPKEQMVSGAFDSLSHIMETYFCKPDEQNVSDEIAEALMRSLIKNIRQAVKDPKDYTARSNLLWESSFSENRLIKLGKKCDRMCHLIENQVGAFTGCNYGMGVAVLYPAYCRYIYKEELPKFARFARNVWKISPDGKSQEELAKAGIEALDDFVREIGLPTSLRQLGVENERQLKEIAASCRFFSGNNGKMAEGEIFNIFRNCF